VSIPDGIDLRCSAVVVRQQAVLLVHRTRGAEDDWVLPGGTPRAGESMAACARREVLEETGLHGGPRTVDIVFAATDAAASTRPERQEPGLTPAFVPVDEIGGLDLRPPLAGHLRGMLSHRGRLYAPYLANLWRPVRSGPQLVTPGHPPQPGLGG
jgi:8-oxo-dGTP diphosphatase